MQIANYVQIYTLYNPHPKPPTLKKKSNFNSDIQLFFHGFNVNTSSDVDKSHMNGGKSAGITFLADNLTNQIILRPYQSL